ncbi:unnamed protein product [Amaranthus hypochondriacus]
MTETVLKLLLKKHRDMMNIVDNKGFNVLHQWAEINKIWQFNILSEEAYKDVRTKMLTELINSQTEREMRYNPIHLAADKGSLEILQELVNRYEIIGDETPPWRAQDKYEQTPLHVAIFANKKEVALYLLNFDITLRHIYDNEGHSPFLVAVEHGFSNLVRRIMEIEAPCLSDLRQHDGATLLHYLNGCSEDLGRELLSRYWWMMNLLDRNENTALQCAVKSHKPWLVKLLKNPSLIPKQPFDWLTACTSDESWAIVSFAKNCKDLPKVCRNDNDTPLHHIKFSTYTEYVEFLQIPTITNLKNLTDNEGKTPLHRALEREDIDLAQALLTDDQVDPYIKDRNGVTAMNILSNLRRENTEWAMMCRQIQVNPDLTTSYIQRGTNLDQIRATLSVVAALLATITFAAGFTLPGGLDDKTGGAKLPKRAAFIVFLLTDTVAMCTSMLVLFCLILSMVSNHNMCRVLVECSVNILITSLYFTTVAFMTGIYTVINHTFLGVLIVFFITCSLIIIFANKTIWDFFIAKLVPAVNQDQEESFQLLEQGRLGIASRSNNQV